MNKIYATITTRDGCVPRLVHDSLFSACSQTPDAELVLVVNQDKYSVAHCRNKAVAHMLAGDYTHLFFCDDDVVVQGDAISLLLAMDADIAAGCYPSFRYPLAVPYITVKANGEWCRSWFNGVREADGAGTGCMLIKRQVIEAVGFPWFRWVERYEDGSVEHVSDDMDFCERAKDKGYRVFANGNVRCGHRMRVDAANFITEEWESPITVKWTGPRTLKQQQAWPDYGSHVPALCSLAKAHNIRRVVEYGSGRFSTPIFLDRQWFPNLESLLSIETDATWMKDTAARNADPRLQLVHSTIADLPSYPIGDADLVLVDCDVTERSGRHDFSVRARLIEKHSADRGIVVVHDADFPQIKPAVDAAPFRHKALYRPTSGPDTAAMSNEVDVRAVQWIDVPLQLAG